VTCSEKIAGPGEPCEGESTAAFEALLACTCEGACASACADSVCMGASDPSDECLACVGDPSGCKTELDACSADTP
jgi:hypothetical protein